jgi:hypothetical protein
MRSNARETVLLRLQVASYEPKNAATLFTLVSAIGYFWFPASHLSAAFRTMTLEPTTLGGFRGEHR